MNNRTSSRCKHAVGFISPAEPSSLTPLDAEPVCQWESISMWVWFPSKRNPPSGLCVLTVYTEKKSWWSSYLWTPPQSWCVCWRLQQSFGSFGRFPKPISVLLLGWHGGAHKSQPLKHDKQWVGCWFRTGCKFSLHPALDPCHSPPVCTTYTGLEKPRRPSHSSLPWESHRLRTDNSTLPDVLTCLKNMDPSKANRSERHSSLVCSKLINGA